MWQRPVLASRVARQAEGSEDPLLAEAKAAAEAAKAKQAEETEDPLLAEAKAAAEAAKLQLEAARLRAEAEELRRSTDLANRKARAERLLGSSEAAGIGLAELMVRLKSEKVDLSGDQALALAAALGQTEDPVFFRFEDLTSEAFDQQLAKFAAEEQARQRAAQEAEQRARADAAAKAASSAGSAASGGEAAAAVPNDDRSTGSRILGCLAYLLPLTEAFKFALPLVQLFPWLSGLLFPVTISAIIINAIPFGSIILFVLFIALAQWKEGVPRLVRFNLEQAVLVDIALTVPGLLLAAVEFSGGGEAIPILGFLTFAVVLAVSVYCASSTLNGEEPEGIPVISNAAKNVVDNQTFFDS